MSTALRLCPTALDGEACITLAAGCDQLRKSVLIPLLFTSDETLGLAIIVSLINRYYPRIEKQRIMLSNKPYIRVLKADFVASVLLLLMASDCDYSLKTPSEPPEGGRVRRDPDNPKKHTWKHGGFDGWAQ